MNSKASSFAFLVIFLLFSSASAFNITQLIGQHPKFSRFNDYLTKTHLSDQINSRQTITVLVFDNDASAAISGKPLEVVKKILSVHVILDYFDIQKLSQLSNDNTTQITTLFQASGEAMNQEGFLKVSLINEGEIAFGSAVKGAGFNSKLVESLVAQPYNISVLQITKAIQVPGIESSPTSPPPSTPVPVGAPPRKAAPSKSPAVAPSAKPKVEAPAPSAKSGDTPVAQTPTGSAGGAQTPKGSAGGSQSPTGSTGGAQTPKGSAGGAQSPTGSTGGAQTPKGSAGGAQSPTGSTGGAQTPTGSTGNAQPPSVADAPETDAAPIGSPISSPPQPADVAETIDAPAEAPSKPTSTASTVGEGAIMGLVSFLVGFYF